MLWPQTEELLLQDDQQQTLLDPDHNLMPWTAAI